MTEFDPLDEILSDAPRAEDTTEVTVTTTETTTQQQRDEAGRFAATAETTTPVEQPPADAAAQAAVEGQGMVPQQALHAARQREKAAQDRADKLEQRLTEFLLNQQRQPQSVPQAETPKPKEFWEDPDGFARNAVTEALTPVQTQMRQFVFTTSKREATREFGAETITAAEQAMQQAISSGQLDHQTVAAQLGASMDPVGDVVRWHKKQSAISRVGDDPDKWLESELERRLSDPTEQAKILERIQGTAAANVNRSGQTPLTRIPPSLNRIPGGGNATPDADQSSGAIFDRVTAR